MKETHMVRLTGLLIINNEVLIIEQKVGGRSWYLPGGKLEKGETLEEGIIREMREETGALVEVERMVCIADSHFKNPAALHILFQLKLCGGEIGVQKINYESVPITNVKFVPISSLTDYGFSRNFMTACQEQMTNIPLYVGKDTYFDLENF